MEGKKGPLLGKRRKLRNLIENQSQIRNPTYQLKDIESKNLSETSKIDFKTSSTSEHYNSHSLLNQENTSQRQIFITLSKITQQERIQIIQRGFRFQAQGAISLKKYYESTDPNSLYQWKGYSITYKSIQRTKLYQNLKK